MSIDLILTHLQDNMMAYIGGLVLLIPLIYFTRQYSVPVILWTLEIIIYTGIFHIFVHFFIKVAVWFNASTQMEQALDRERTTLTWQTPLVEFWRRDLYDPGWVFYFECVFLIGAAILVYRMRPMKTQKIKPKPEKRPGQRGYRASGNRPGTGIHNRRR